jgi:hypothetical protein
VIEAALLDEYIERFSNWGRWGDDDQAGTANFITSSKVAAAAAACVTGRSSRLA